ncbi:DNA-binding response regulator [Paenibacillus sp. 598K]|uniref:response regulator n=1 Tax=Paenibacillus sp. 598K TaxID=1117987 RepID=UPI000FFACFEF|nr:response regulator [Paenibacillus sp. 598K]GBF72940.1 DNA-binding response regulator [Paenibacillus sp. 598K]
MLRLLIVDDEATILDGLVELFHEAALPDLEINYASSGLQALRLIQMSKIDIVLTDIRMPGMSGLELFDCIRADYPRCRVVFLTGYNDFQYVQEVLRKGGVDYVLKMDGDDEIIAAVQKAIAAIGEDMDKERLIREARDRMRATVPLMQRELVQYLILGEPLSQETLAHRFTELDIPLKPDLPVFMVAGRTDSWNETLKPSEKALLSFAVQNIMEEFMPPSFSCLAVTLDSTFHMLWLIQPQSDMLASTEQRLQDLLESTQQAARSFLKLPLSFAASGEMAWTELGRTYGRLSELSYRSAGIGLEIAFLQDQRELVKEPGRQINDELRLKLRRFVFLEAHLDNHRESEFKRELSVLLHSVADTRAPLPIRLEVFHKVASLFLSYMNRMPYEDLDDSSRAMQMLTRFDLHASWDELSRYFLTFADELFIRRQKTQTDRGLEIVAQINSYIERNLASDLSLTRLGRVVFLNPAYLSRLYKQISGNGLSDVVTEKRMAKAKEILRTTDMKVQDVAAAVGLESPSYFARLFKRMTSLSPQEYRESQW